MLSLILGLTAFLRQIRLHFDFVEFAFPLCFQELHDACIVFSGTPEMPFKREPTMQRFLWVAVHNGARSIMQPCAKGRHRAFARDL